MIVTSCMKRNVVSVHAMMNIREAAEILVKKHIGLLPAVGNPKKLSVS